MDGAVTRLASLWPVLLPVIWALAKSASLSYQTRERITEEGLERNIRVITRLQCDRAGPCRAHRKRACDGHCRIPSTGYARQ